MAAVETSMPKRIFCPDRGAGAHSEAGLFSKPAFFPEAVTAYGSPDADSHSQNIRFTTLNEHTQARPQQFRNLAYIHETQNERKIW